MASSSDQDAPGPGASRPCIGLEIPPGPAGVDVLMPAMRAALDGSGPAIAPLARAAADSTALARIRSAVRPGEPVPDEVAVVAATSGSTGNPAGVLLPGAALRAASRALAERFDAPDGHRWVAALPLYHAGGLMVGVRSVVAGTVPIALDSLGGAARFTLAGLAEATARARALSDADGLPLAVSLVPAMLAEVDTHGAEGWDVLCEYDLVLVGGAAAPGALVDRLRFAGVSLSTSYGMTETCGGAVFDGRPLPGVAVSVDADRRLVIEGDQVALGYRDGRDAQRWSTSEAGRRSFRTGDLGRLDDHGRVHVEGRADDVVQVGGASVALGAVRRALLGDPRVADVEVVALPDERWGARIVAVVVETLSRTGAPPAAPAPPGFATELGDRLASELGTAARPRAVLVVPAIPLLRSGKPDREALAELASELTSH